MNGEIPNVFATTIHKSMGWLHDIEAETGWNQQRAYRALRATLHVLRDRLTIDQAAHLGAQLPMLVRGFYYEGWHPAGCPNKQITSRDDFCEAIEREAFDREMGGETAMRVCLGVLACHITEGEMRKLTDQLPKSIAACFPNGSQAQPNGRAEAQARRAAMDAEGSSMAAQI